MTRLQSRRRFTLSALAAVAVVAIPYLWVLSVDWNRSPNLLRKLIPSGYTENFYDLQARAIMSGHLYVPAGPLGIEAWMHNGHAYTYFGLFPSLLRVPVLAMTHSLDGRLTALSLLCSWLVTALFTTLLLWRVRVMVRADAPLGWTESVACGTVIASVLGGSVLVFLASTPFVYSEDKAWSVALSLAAFYALLGVTEKPTPWRIGFTGLMVTLTGLTRITEAFACIIGTLLVALWFAVSRREREHRTWSLSLFGIAVVAGGLACLVNWAKFGVPFGLPVHDYVAYRYLHEGAINGGHYFGLLYFPTDIVTYLQPWGIGMSRLFPYITLPPGPPMAIGHVLFDNRSRTASITSSMPLLVVLSAIGTFGIFRRHVQRSEVALRILVVAAASGTGAVLFYGWIANRYLADFLPALVLAAAAGAILLWRQMHGWTRRGRVIVCAVTVALGVFSIFANFGIALSPSQFWTPLQGANYLRMQKSMSGLTGQSMIRNIRKGNSLPRWAPAGTVFVIGNCDALYLSNGEDFSFVPVQNAEHDTWLLVEAGPGFQNHLRVTVDASTGASLMGVPLATIGSSTLLMHSEPAGQGKVSFWLSLQDPRFPNTGLVTSVTRESTLNVSLFTDRYAGTIEASVNGLPVISGPMSAGGPVIIVRQASGMGEPFHVAKAPSPPGRTDVCRQLHSGS